MFQVQGGGEVPSIKEQYEISIPPKTYQTITDIYTADQPCIVTVYGPRFTNDGSYLKINGRFLINGGYIGCQSYVGLDSYQDRRYGVIWKNGEYVDGNIVATANSTKVLHSSTKTDSSYPIGEGYGYFICILEKGDKIQFQHHEINAVENNSWPTMYLKIIVRK